jgi:hypothetical protein
MTSSRITLGVIATALAAVVLLDPAGARDPEPAAAYPCHVVEITDDVPQYAVDSLIAQGWTSRPDDAREALYSPLCG